MDLVFVDGHHGYEYVKNDTEKGWEMLRSSRLSDLGFLDPKMTFLPAT
jgi:hypothetical protein